MTIRRSVLVVGVLAATLAGCPPDEASAPDVTWDEVSPPSEGDAAGGREYALIVRMRMVTISVPLGAASGSEQLWSYLNTEAIEAVRTGSLGRNGLRAGLAPRESWQDVADVLEQMTGTRRKTTVMTCLPGGAVSVEVRRDQPMQTLFVYNRDRTLSGRDYPPADNLLTFFCSLNPDDPSQVTLTVLPQLRTARRRPAVVNRGEVPMIASRPTYFSFEDLAFRVTVPSRDVLIIGPGSGSRRSSSVGNRFLLKRRDGVPHETVLVVIPQVIAAKHNADGAT
ncbi:MAG: hypothetical protein ACOC8F_03070 [Planctomycetota bacterium]